MIRYKRVHILYNLNLELDLDYEINIELIENVLK